MKYQSIDRKQLPQVIGLAVACLGLIGYAGSKLVSGLTSAPAAAAVQPPAGQPSPPAPQGERTPGSFGEAQPLIASRGGTYRDDPFHPMALPGAPAPPGSPPPGEPPSRRTSVAPSAPPSLPRAPALEPPAVHLQPPPPPNPAALRPANLVVTGVIDGQPDMAIIRLGETDRRILFVGDQLPGGYRVKRIQIDGVLLESPMEQWFVPLGPKATELASLR